MSFLSKLGFSSRKKEREEQLNQGDRILVEFGRDRVAVYINMFEIPRDAKTLVDVMARSRLNRRIKLPDVAKFMYDDYTTWVDTVEVTAVQKSWGYIILLAYTTKVLQDGSKHDKALLTMMTKGEAVGYQKELMFKSDDWNLLHLHFKAGDTRDEGMRQVLHRLFSRSVGLWELLNIPTQELLDVGLDRDKAVTDAIGEAVRITNSEVDKSESAMTEILPVENLDLNDEEAESGKNNKKMEITVRLPPRQEKAQSTTTEGDMEAALKKLPSNLQASKWATGSITQGVANVDVIGEKKAEDTSVEYGVPTEDMQTSVPVVEEPKVLREVSGEAPPTPQEAEQIAAFTPKKQLPRLPSGLQLPVYTPNVYTASEDDKNSDYASAFSPRHEIPRSTATSPRKSAFHENELPTITKDHFAYQDQHSDEEDRKIANLKYRKSVLNTQRAKQATWSGDAPRNSEASSVSSSSTRQPKGPPVTGDWKELKGDAVNWAHSSQNFAEGAVPQAEGPSGKRMRYSFKKGVHSVDSD